MTDILEGKHGVYNLDKREDCYAYLCREAGLNGQQLSMLERIYSTPAPVEVEDLLDHIISAANSVSIPSESNYLNELKSRLLAALSNKGENLSGDVIVPGTEMIPKEWPDDSISIPDNPDEWTDADYENAMALVRPIFDQIGTYEAKHFPMDEPSREAQEEFRRDQMGEVLIIDHHQSLLELGNILFHDARPTNEIESTGIKKYWLSKSRIIPYKKIK